jgi:hypothetical protein
MKQSLRIILGIQLLLFFACSNESKDNSSLILKRNQATRKRAT